MNIKLIKKFLKGNQESIASVSNIFQSVAAIVTVIGIGFAGYEYDKQQQNIREQKAFELYQQFNEGDFLKSRNQFKQAYYDKREENPDFYESTGKYISAMESVWQDQYVDIISLKDFFEQVATCVKSNLCDEDVTRALFGKEAQEFFEINYDLFCLERNKYKDKDMGEILQKFVQKANKNCDHIESHIAKNP